jgi:hypothetical protein
MTKELQMTDGTQYLRRDSIGADVFCEWRTKHPRNLGFAYMSDSAFLIERMLVDDKGRPVKASDVPPYHIPELYEPMMELLCLDKFNAAMDRLMSAREDDGPGEGEEKNSQTG